MSTATHPHVDKPAPAAVPKPAPGSFIADPAALGLAGFALTTVVLSVVNAGWVPSTVEPVVFGLAFAYGGIAQLCAGLWEFARGNTFGATAFCSYGGFWLSFWYLTGHTDLSGAGSAVNQGLGLYLIAWAVFTLYMTVAAMHTNNIILTVFVLLTITYILLALGEFFTADPLTTLGGYVGILTALAAWYGSFAVVTNSTFKRTVVPIGPRE